MDAGDFRLNGMNETIAGIQSIMTGDGLVENQATTSSTMTLAPQAGKTYTFSGLIRDGITGKLAVVVSGSGGTQVVAGQNNTYTGTTTVSAGRLVVSGSISGSITTVNGASDPNATLAGNGVISQNVTLTLGHIAPGLNNANSNLGAAGTFTLASAGTLTLTNATLDFDMAATNGAGSSDQIVTGALNLGSTVAFTFNELSLGNLQTGVNYTLIHGTSAIVNQANVTGITYTVLNADYTAVFSIGGASNNDLLVQFSAIPEPQTWVMLLSGVGMLTLLRRRR